MSSLKAARQDWAAGVVRARFTRHELRGWRIHDRIGYSSGGGSGSPDLTRYFIRAIMERCAANYGGSRSRARVRKPCQ
jgi:hypothetical protein